MIIIEGQKPYNKPFSYRDRNTGVLYSDNEQHEQNNGLRVELVKGVGGTEQLHKDAGKWLTQHIDDDQVHRFNSVEDMLETMANQHVLWAHNDSKGLGPKTLGARPPFRGEAADMNAGEGRDRRHVIACSTLGKAIERSGGSLEEINRFITSNNGTPNDDERLARREAWKIVNSHVGNLWPGGSNNNRAAGFIRGPIAKTRAALTGDPDADQTASINTLTNKLRNEPQGPLTRATPKKTDRPEDHISGTNAWKSMGSVMSTVLDSQQHRRDPSHPYNDPRPDLVEPNQTDETLIDDLKDLERNADLDLPSHDNDNEPISMGGTDYYEKLTEVYVAMREVSDAPEVDGVHSDINLFAEGGVLDQYMALDLHQINSVKMRPLGQDETVRSMFPRPPGDAPGLPGGDMDVSEDQNEVETIVIDDSMGEGTPPSGLDNAPHFPSQPPPQPVLTVQQQMEAQIHNANRRDGPPSPNSLRAYRLEHETGEKRKRSTQLNQSPSEGEGSLLQKQSNKTPPPKRLKTTL